MFDISLVNKKQIFLLAMESFYAFDWYHVDIDQRAEVICICKNVNNDTVLLRICDYHPYCYILGSQYSFPSSNNLTDNKMYDKKIFDTFISLSYYKKYKKTYMSDEDPICVFLATYKLEYIGWIDIQYAYIATNKISKYDEYYVSVTNIIKNNTIIKTPQLRIAAFDIEVYSSTKGMPKSYIHDDKIFMISIVTNDNQEFLINNDDELQCLDTFSQYINDIDPDIITGFNIFNFDIQYMYDRCLLYLTTLPEISRISIFPTTYEHMQWSNASYGMHKFLKPNVAGRCFIDIFQYAKRLNLDRYNLQYISEKFLGVGKNNLTNDEMRKLYQTHSYDDMQIIAEYCLQDSRLVVKLCDVFDIITDFVEKSKIMKCKIEEILTRGEQLKINHQLIFECIERNIILESTGLGSWDESYEGAMVFDPIPGLYHNCVMLDYQSLYPSVIIANNICPSSFVTTISSDDYIDLSVFFEVNIGNVKHIFRKTPIGILPKLLEKLLAERYAVKAAMLVETSINVKNILDKRQNSLKIAANSVYGITGAKYSKYLRHKPCAESISGLGRYYFKRLVEFMRQNNHDVIYGDTDSCMISYPTWSSSKCISISKKLCEAYSDTLPKPMLLNYENFYDKVIILAKKKYIMYTNNKIAYKGVAITKRGYCKYVKDVYMDLIKLLFEESSMIKIGEYIINKTNNLLEGNVIKEDLVISKSTKNPNEYKNNVPQKVMLERIMEDGEEIYTGMRLEYVFVATKSIKQGDKMYNLSEVIKNNMRIDYRYYVDKQLMNSVDQLMNLLGAENFLKSYLRILDNKSII